MLILLLVFFAMGILLGIPDCIIEINEDWVRIEKKIIPKAIKWVINSVAFRGSQTM